MEKCPICSSAKVVFDDSVNDSILSTLDPDGLVISATYKHTFDYCPECGIIDYPFTQSQLEYLKNNNSELLDIVSSNLFKDIDPKQTAKSCLLAAKCFELVSDYTHSAICYKACEDNLSGFLIKYLNKNKTGGGNINYGTISNINLSYSDNQLMVDVEDTINMCREKVITLTKNSDLNYAPVLVYNVILTFINLNNMDSAITLLNAAKEMYAGTDDNHDQALNYIQSLINKLN